MNNLSAQLDNLRRFLPSHVPTEMVNKIVSIAYGIQIDETGEITKDSPFQNNISLSINCNDLPPFQRLQQVINMVLNLKYSPELGRLSEMAPSLIAFMHGEEHFSTIEKPLLPPSGMIDPHTEDPIKLTAVKNYYGHPALVTSLFGFYYSEHTYLLGQSLSGKSRLIQNELTLTELKKHRVIVITGKDDKYEFIRSQGMKNITCFECDYICDVAVEELFNSKSNLSILSILDDCEGVLAADVLQLIVEKFSSTENGSLGIIFDGLKIQFSKPIKTELKKLSEKSINICFTGTQFENEIYENAGFVYLLKPSPFDVYPEQLASIVKDIAYYDSKVIKKDIPFISLEQKSGKSFHQRYPFMPDEHFVNAAPSLFQRIFSRSKMARGN